MQKNLYDGVFCKKTLFSQKGSMKDNRLGYKYASSTVRLNILFIYPCQYKFKILDFETYLKEAVKTIATK